ncbi:MAG: heme o synthase [Parachlamydia sp.]|jgi:protoheme IX farnesyltransferase|nr:heme o synthase [Parachlamydia sp.]
MAKYYLLLKPGIIMGNLMTLIAGYLLASKGHFVPVVFFAVFFGLAFVIASACIFNNYIDRERDKKMERTRERALVKGTIPAWQALTLAVFLAVLGSLILYYFTNPLTLAVSSAGFFIYVILYSFWKAKTIYGTALGSIAGAVPPVAGYTAASNQLDTGALLLFAMLVLWQMPHFFAIALMHLKDYTNAGIPVLPVMRGIKRTKVHMLAYVCCFILAVLLLPLFHYAGPLFLIAAALSSFGWLIICLQGFSAVDDRLWGKQMFKYSLLVITALCLAIPIEFLFL